MPETAYLYDAVHLYERSLLKALDENRDPRNGREMLATLYGVNYRSAMGYVLLEKSNGEEKRNLLLTTWKSIFADGRDGNERNVNPSMYFR